MEQISVLQVIGLFLFLIIGLCLYALQLEKFDDYRWHIFGTCIAAFIGTGVVGYLAFVPTPYTPPEILNDSPGGGGGGGAAGKSTGDGKKKGGKASGGGGTPGGAGEKGSGGGGAAGGGGSASGSDGDNQKPGSTFADCETCPKMVVVPRGENQIGSPEGDDRYPANEKPQTTVRILQGFAVSQYEISLKEFSSFVKATGFNPSGTCNTDGVGSSKANYLSPAMNQEEASPVVCVSFEDAEKYTEWLSQESERPYRLLSEAEWEYTRRGATSLAEASAPREGPPETGNIKGDVWVAQTTPAATYNANPFKVFDMQGNASEWTLDCWHKNHESIPATGEPRTTTGDCAYHAVRGGSWDDKAVSARPASRIKKQANTHDWRIGFRVMSPVLTPPASEDEKSKKAKQ